MPALVPARNAPAVADHSRLAADPRNDGFEDFDSSEIALRPGDSHYELSSNFQGFADDDSQVDLPAFDPPEQEPTRIHVASAVDRSKAESGNWDIGIWLRYQLVATLAFGGSALGVLGFYLLRSSIGGQAPTPATAALVVGFLATVAFVLLSLAVMVLHAMLGELSRELGRLHKRLD